MIPNAYGWQSRRKDPLYSPVGGTSRRLRGLMLRMKKKIKFLVFNVFKIFVKIFVYNDC